MKKGRKRDKRRIQKGGEEEIKKWIKKGTKKK
jgi:hypothetical protein